MSNEFSYPEHRPPSVTPTLVLWLLFIAAIALGAYLVLTLADTGQRPDRVSGVDAPVRGSGDVDRSAVGLARPNETPAVDEAPAYGP